MHREWGENFNILWLLLTTSLIFSKSKSGFILNLWTTVYDITVTVIDAISDRNSQIGQTRIQISAKRGPCSFRIQISAYWHGMITRVSLFKKILSATAVPWRKVAFGSLDVFKVCFRSLSPNTFLRSALKVFAKRYIRSNFQSCHWWPKLKIQSHLTLLITKIPSLPILSHKCGFYLVKLSIWNWQF